MFHRLRQSQKTMHLDRESPLILNSKWITKLRAVTNCTQTVFNQLYVSTLYQVHVHLKSKRHLYEFVAVDTLIETQFNLGIAALRLRQGVLLPCGDTIENIAKEEHRWTYAVFSAALVFGLPILEKPEELFPELAIRFLKANEPLFKIWMDCLSGFDPASNQLHQVIEKAHMKLGLTQKQQSDPKQNVQDTFIHYLIDNCGDLIFRIQEGLFVDERHLNQQNIEAETLLKSLENLLIKNQGDCFHKLYSKRFEDQRTLRGIILKIECLPVSLAKAPINQQYQTTSI